MTALPRSLVEFESELSQAIERDLGSRAKPGRRPVVRLVLVAAAATAVALGVLSVVPGHGPSVVDRAVAALTGSGDSILHIAAVVRQTQGGTETTWRLETWQETSPYTVRWLRVDSGGRQMETLDVDGSTQLYDAATNTIYTNSAGVTKPGAGAGTLPPAKEVASGSKVAPAAGPTPSKPGVEVPQSGSGDPYRDKILAILQSGSVAVKGHASVDGRDALRLVSDDGSAIIFVDPQTYRPIQWRTSSPDGTEATTFDTYEELPRSQANDALLSLTAQHPSARIDDSAADYQAAVDRLAVKP